MMLHFRLYASTVLSLNKLAFGNFENKDWPCVVVGLLLLEYKRGTDAPKDATALWLQAVSNLILFKLVILFKKLS